MKEAKFKHSPTIKPSPSTFSPILFSDDSLANYWMRQVMLRLRRELCWLRYERGMIPNANPDALPLYTDKASEILNFTRFREEKDKFFQTDTTANYLTAEIDGKPPEHDKASSIGSFSWVIEQLSLDDSSAFILATGLLVAFDSAAGNVVAACLNDTTKTQPNLSLAQKLWDAPDKILPIVDAEHVLFSSGILQIYSHSMGYSGHIDWETPLSVPSMIANQLLFPSSLLPQTLQIVKTEADPDLAIPDKFLFIASRIKTASEKALKVVPVLGPENAQHMHTAEVISKLVGRELAVFRGDPTLLENTSYRSSLATFCWLKELNLFFDEDVVSVQQNNKQANGNTLIPLRTIPITLFLGITSREALKSFPKTALLPVVMVPKLTYEDRFTLWQKELGDVSVGMETIIQECARRFRYEKKEIQAICRGLNKIEKPISGKNLITACRLELDTEFGELAQKVTPRFQDEEVILPYKQAQQLKEIHKAMTSLTQVHYGWGTARSWNESGIAVLFAGPPGTGKTMAAEVLAIKLNMPLYRIDLSQVVNKYIGETEKNLKRLFDAADKADLILFFDEADAVFGRRTEVKDAHDRYANLEISYLLERMERFKGMAILATNRKKDLDDAFLRRLRYVLDFPLPEVEQRKMIWRQVIPSSVDQSNINLDFLAEKFPLAGGHIRSIVFNACLQSTDHSNSDQGKKTIYKMEMEAIIRAVKREYEKLNRSISLEQFGSYINVVQKMEKENGKY